MAAEDEIRQASEQFYEALNRLVNGDPRLMAEIWSHNSDVATMHPIGGRQVGWEQVRASWEQVAQALSDGQVSLEDPIIFPIADDVAYILGIERGEAKFGGEPISIDWRVTNIYRREGDGWKIVLHHTDVSPAMVETLSRLES